MSSVNSLTLSDEQVTAICEFAEVISCKCPAYLTKLLQQVKQFRSYTTDCVDMFPEDVATHEWLTDRALQIETFLIQTIYELLKREGLLDENGQLNCERLGQHSRSNALRQLGLNLTDLKPGIWKTSSPDC